ncbi:hypothetical protein ACC717_03845 [Rhizobium ruizarguesonis]|uniref:Uncharacterized protein n=1 Tax=Rhizobium ruizarguesonis TaxID=2081791 RepID=A0AB38I4R9_9HYPH|nr:hypothetical protein [Rhizobium ruizarguesonis]TBB66211.1 hypothetical protein ELH42_08585 [Rhizobium ruizarguesonis]TBB70603.1 hypothetical protein ELH45_08635 [Rhizobium ruizarguesonis]TBC15633.1 hypothetical protein ELH40_12200 [Rhizobium ruizarguesonis]
MSMRKRHFTTFDAIKSAEIPKYDMLFKNMLLTYNSSLLQVLGIQNETVAAIELPGFDGRKIDGIVEEGDDIHHLEFQTKPDLDMRWRLLEYYFKLIEHFADDDFVLERDVKQKLIYVGGRPGGTENLGNLRSPLRKDGLRFEYEFIDLRKIRIDFVKLENSDLPMDWVLRVLCDDLVQHHHWEAAARKLARHTTSRPRDAANLKASLLIAAALREIRRDKVRKLEDMLQINIENVPLLAEAYDDVREREANRTGYRFVLRAFEARRIKIPEKVDELLRACDENEHQELVPVVYRAKTFAPINELLETFARRYEVDPPSLSMNGG